MFNFLIVSILLIFLSFNSYAKVGDRFNCMLSDSVTSNFPLSFRKYKFFPNEDYSKFILITILDNDKASLEHSYGKQVITFKKFDYPSAGTYNKIYRYTGTEVKPLTFYYRELTGFLNTEGYAFLIISSPFGNHSLNISEYKCTKLS
tara:strand:+ start:89 stop:529 length:441 start_codon:yes stop_codon:yes gene_type:complete